MNIFPWKKNLNISGQDPVYKVRYLGNVQTSIMKGTGCVDKPVAVIWNNYLKSSHPGLEMKLVISASGLKAHTKDQGLTDYRAHRLTYCIAHPKYPRLFVWVYRHEGRRMKMEPRCHAALCHTDADAKAMAVQLHDKLAFALKEFQREKLRQQNSRLLHQKVASPSRTGSAVPLRKQFLSTGSNFKPPVSMSTCAPKLGSIEEHADEMEEVEDEVFYVSDNVFSPVTTIEISEVVQALTLLGSDTISTSVDSGISVEVGNDIERLRHDLESCGSMTEQDSDEESSESGFHEQDPRDLGPFLVIDSDSDEGSVCEFPSPIIRTQPPSPDSRSTNSRCVSYEDLQSVEKRGEEETVVTQL